jgi:hypothetical protein
MSTVLLSRDQLAGRPRDVWAYISPSRLTKWLSCPLAFKIQYVDGIRSPTTPALFLGKMIHAALEVYYRHRQLGVTLAATDVLGNDQHPPLSRSGNGRPRWRRRQKACSIDAVLFAEPFHRLIQQPLRNLGVVFVRHTLRGVAQEEALQTGESLIVANQGSG